MSYRSSSRNDQDQRHRADHHNNDRDKDRNLYDRRGRDSGTDRDRGIDYRDRGDDKDRGRTDSSMSVQSPSELHSAVSGISPFPPAARPNSASTAQDVSKALREVKDVELSLVQLNYEECILDRQVKHEKDGFQSNQHRHADYPNLKDMHQSTMNRLAVQREDLKRRRKPVDEQYKRLTDAVAYTLVNALPALVEKKEAQNSVDHNLAEQLRTLQNRVESMSQSTERSDKNYSRLEEKQKELEENNKTLVKRIQDLEHENKTLKEQFKGQSKLIGSTSQKVVALETTIQNEKADRESALRKSQDTVNNKLLSLEEVLGGQRVEIDKQGTDLKSTRQTQAKHQERLESVNGTVQTLSSKQDSDLKSLRQTQAKQQERVDSINGSLQALSFKQETMADSISTLNKTTKAQAGTLSSLETRSRTTAVQSRPVERSTVSTGSLSEKAISDLKTDMDSIRDFVRSTEQNLESNTSKLIGVDGRLKRVEESFPRIFGKMIEDLKKKTEDLQKTTTTIDKRAATQKEPSDSIASALVPQIQALNDKYDMISTAMTSLDHQMNNLTTKELAEHIIGHLEQIVPNARQIQEDMDAMVAKVHGFDDELEQKVEQKMEKIYDQINSNAQAANAALMQGADRTSRKRTFEQVNGHHDGNRYRGSSANGDSH